MWRVKKKKMDKPIIEFRAGYVHKAYEGPENC